MNIYYETGGGTGYDGARRFHRCDALRRERHPQVRHDDHLVPRRERDRSRAQPLAQKQIVKDFVDQGGRVFGSHFSFGYFRGVPGTTDAKNFQPSPGRCSRCGTAGPMRRTASTPRFPKGQAFADWLVITWARRRRAGRSISRRSSRRRCR